MVARELRLPRGHALARSTPAGTKHRADRRRKGDPRSIALASFKVTAQPDIITGSLTITAQGYSPTVAAQVANAFASELLIFLDTSGRFKYDVELAQLQQQRDAELRSLQTADLAPPTTDPFLKLSADANRAAIVTRLDAIDQDILTTAQNGPDTAGLRTLEAASPWTAAVVPVKFGKNPILSSVQSGPSRLLAGAGIGLLISIAGLLLLEVLSARLRDVAAVEGATRLPVIAEIPDVKLGPRRLVPGARRRGAGRTRGRGLSIVAHVDARDVATPSEQHPARTQPVPSRPRPRRRRCAPCSSRRRARPRASRSQS